MNIRIYEKKKQIIIHMYILFPANNTSTLARKNREDLNSEASFKHKYKLEHMEPSKGGAPGLWLQWCNILC